MKKLAPDAASCRLPPRHVSHGAVVQDTAIGFHNTMIRLIVCLQICYGLCLAYTPRLFLFRLGGRLPLAPSSLRQLLLRLRAVVRRHGRRAVAEPGHDFLLGGTPRLAPRQRHVRVVALCLGGELLELLGSSEVGDDGSHGALGRGTRGGVNTREQSRIPSIEHGALRVVGQALVQRPIPEIAAPSTARFGLALHIIRQPRWHGALGGVQQRAA